MFDTLIKNGTLLDGSGQPAQRGNIAIQNSIIQPIGHITATATAKRTVDATGLLVTPGFVDIHTITMHKPAGATVWTTRPPTGGTTAVIGNCGVGFATSRLAVHTSSEGRHISSNQAAANELSTHRPSHGASRGRVSPKFI